MKTYPIKDEFRKSVAFEIDLILISIHDLIIILNANSLINSVSKVKNCRIEGERAGFNYKGKEYCVIEPFSDNSRYWIGPSDGVTNSSEDLTPLIADFEVYKPSFLRQVIFQILSLEFLKTKDK